MNENNITKPEGNGTKKETQTKPEQKVQDKSKKIRRPFLKTEKGFITKEVVPVEELKEFVLLLMKNNGHTDFIENIQAGEFYMKTEDGKQEKSLLLTPNKLTTFNYYGQYFKGWIAHEDNMSPYPESPLHSGEMYKKTVQKLSMNYKDANDAKYLEAKTKMLMYIIIGSLFVLYVIYTFGKKAGWFGGGVEPVIIETAKTTAEIATNTGVVVS